MDQEHQFEVTVNDASKTRVFQKREDGSLEDITPPDPEEAAADVPEKKTSARNKDKSTSTESVSE